MAEIAVVNASPLIFLGRAGRLELLRDVTKGRCIVPEPVQTEIARRGSEDPTLRALATSPWLTVEESPMIPETIAAWGLGAGESSVLALSMVGSAPRYVAVIDDRAARHCASALGIPLLGTLSVVLIAKKRGIIPLARPVMEELLSQGMYLSRRILDQALTRVGE